MEILIEIAKVVLVALLKYFANRIVEEGKAAIENHVIPILKDFVQRMMEWFGKKWNEARLKLRAFLYCYEDQPELQF